MKYKVTLYLEANTHPRKWIPETIWESLDDGEHLLTYRIEQMVEEDGETGAYDSDWENYSRNSQETS